MISFILVCKNVPVSPNMQFMTIVFLYKYLHIYHDNFVYMCKRLAEVG